MHPQSLSKISAATLLALAVASAQAVPVQIVGNATLAGRDSAVTGPLASVAIGAPMTVSFMVDSDVFTNDPAHPTRGYTVDRSTLRLSIGGIDVPFDSPQSSATTYFVLRLNDPRAEGMFLSNGSTAVDLPSNVRIPGMEAAPMTLSFSRTFTSDFQPWNTLDILDAQGTWGMAHMSVFGFHIDSAGGRVMLDANYDNITISAVPEPATWLSLSLGGLALIGLSRRRRQQQHRD